MRKIELLAPVGSKEALVAAVFNGADAVYLAGKAFGARKFAANFDRDELAEAVAFCHRHGVSVFVTVNTLVADAEADNLKEYIDFLYGADVDAVIVQDFGVLRMIQTAYPDFEVHASTQMTAHSSWDMAYLKKMGVERVVLPREMPLDEISELRKKTDLDFECFVHGALCISYSGQCLMSSMIGGRSGNRGSCAQSCRQPYTLVDTKTGLTQKHDSGKYLLSPKDLRSLRDVPSIIEAGVDSFKIEGRMKRPEYAAIVVRAYREAIDAALENRPFDLEAWEAKTASIFTRGFTSGHLGGAPTSDRMNPDWPGNFGVAAAQVTRYFKDKSRMEITLETSLHVGDEVQIRRGNGSVGARVEFIEIGRARVKAAEPGQTVIMNMQYPVRPGEAVYKTVDDVLLKEARQSFARQVQRVDINVQLSVKSGEAIQLMMSDHEGHEVTVKGEKPEPAINRPLDADRIEKQLLKLGDTPYLCGKAQIDLDEGLSLPMRALNEIRREAVEALDKQRETRYAHRQAVQLAAPAAVSDTVSDSEGQNRMYTAPVLMAQVRTYEQYTAASEEGVDAIAVSDLGLLERILESHKQRGEQLIFAPGRIVRDADFSRLDKSLDLIRACDGIWAGTYGMIEWARERKIDVLGLDQGLNVFNSEAVAGHASEAPIITLSPEMTLGQIEKLRTSDAELQGVTYGRQTVMVTEYCPISATLSEGRANCGLCESAQYGLQDKTGAVFPIIRSNERCRTEILNSKILFVPEELDNLYDAGVRNFRMIFTLESGEDTADAIRLYKHTLDHNLDLTDDDIRTRFTSKGLTRGHYFRGILDDE